MTNERRAAEKRNTTGQKAVLVLIRVDEARPGRAGPGQRAEETRDGAGKIPMVD